VNCGVMIDSTSATALTLSGNNTRLNAASVNIVGSYAATGGATVTPAPFTHVFAEADPLASISAPAVGACTATSFSSSSGEVRTIAPGVYCGGISVSGGAHLTLSAGTYILKGGGLTVAGNSALFGNGVSIYNTYGVGYTYGAISLAGGATIQLSAPVTGPLAAILMFQDRSVVGGVASTVAGNATSFFDGALYFPTTALTFTGGTGSTYTIIVAKRLTCTGGTTLNNNYSSLPAGPPVRGSASVSE
jgi:hypothetical protein